MLWSCSFVLANSMWKWTDTIIILTGKEAVTKLVCCLTSLCIRKWFEFRSYEIEWNLIVWVKWAVRRTVGSDWRFAILSTSNLQSQDSKDDFCSGYSNVSYHQQSFSGRTSHEWSNSTQVFVLFTNYLRKIYCPFFFSVHEWPVFYKSCNFIGFWEQVVFSPPIWPTQTGSIYHLHLKVSQSQSATWRTF